MPGDEPRPRQHPAGHPCGISRGSRGAGRRGRHVDAETPAHGARRELGVNERRAAHPGLGGVVGGWRGTGHLRATRLARHDRRPGSWLGCRHRRGDRRRLRGGRIGRGELARRENHVAHDVADGGDVVAARSRVGSCGGGGRGRRQGCTADQAQERRQRRNPAGREREPHRAGIGASARRGAGADGWGSGRRPPGIAWTGHLSRLRPRARRSRARRRPPAAAAARRRGPG